MIDRIVVGKLTFRTATSLAFLLVGGPYVKRWLPISLDHFIAYMEKLVQTIVVGYLDSKNQKPSSLFKVGHPMKIRE